MSECLRNLLNMYFTSIGVVSFSLNSLNSLLRSSPSISGHFKIMIIKAHLSAGLTFYRSFVGI